MNEPEYGYRHISLALDNSAHSNRGIELGLAIAGLFEARVTGTHAYAAKLHDMRFRQMEGGLPEQFRQEEELERQRDVHDTLITRGLEVITDAYLDVAAARATEMWVRFERKSLEGKNYRALLDDIEASDYDLVVLGAQGLGAVKRSTIGSVCERLVRRVRRDVLVVRDPARGLDRGPIMVAVDGSTNSFGALRTALLLAHRFERPLEVVSAFDPFFHYVAFNSIAEVLSEEAGQVFKFQEQEALHEEIIDSGLARIYQSHLAIAEKIAADHGVAVETKLLAGKPFEAILEHLQTRDPCLLVLGRIGVHADGGMDIGSNAENLLRQAPCHLLFSSRRFQPPAEQIAEETTSWTEEAETSMLRVPSFVRNMARTAILRYAVAEGHTVITSSIVDEAVGELLPASAMEAMGMLAQAAVKHDREKAQAAERESRTGAEPTFDGRYVVWQADARGLLTGLDDATRRNVELRAEKLAHRETGGTVTAGIVRRVSGSPTEPRWSDAARERIERVPAGFMRDRSRERVLEHARHEGLTEITLGACEAALARAREAMMSMMAEPDPAPSSAPGLPWTTEAAARLKSVPEGFMRDLTRQRVEAKAHDDSLAEVTLDVVERTYAGWAEGSARVESTLPWSPEAEARVERVPPFVRGMVVKEVERRAAEMGQREIDVATFEGAISSWSRTGGFHRS